MGNARVAILGCGYVGAALGRALAAAGHDVLGTTTTPARVPALQALGLTPAIVELADTEKLRILLVDRTVVYLTVAAGGGRHDYRTVYLDGVRHLLGAVRGTAVRRIIYTSSSAVYGRQDGAWVDETTAPEPADERGRVLFEAERTLLEGAAQRGGDPPVVATIVRLSGIYGPGRDPAAWAARTAGTTRTDGDAYLNLIHVDDIIEALVRLLTVPYAGVLNLSDDAPTPRRAFYDRLISAAGLAPVRWAEADAPPALGKRIRNDLIKRTLGLSLNYPTH